jgi:acyl-CoA thioester hydrolase
MERYGYLHRVTYADCTVGNHIYYGRYLELLEAARGEWFRSMGKSFADWQAAGLIFPVLEVQIHYRSPARYDEVLTIEVWVLEARGVRLNVGYRVLGSEGQVRVEGHTYHVCANLEDKPRRLPAELMSALGVPAGGLRSSESEKETTTTQLQSPG